MIMKIELSEEKAKAHKYSVEKCYSVLDNFFKASGINKIGRGMYQCDNFCDMARAQINLQNASWFIQVVQKWHCNYVSNDKDKYMEDCLEAHFKVEARYRK